MRSRLEFPIKFRTYSKLGARLLGLRVAVPSWFNQIKIFSVIRDEVDHVSSIPTCSVATWNRTFAPWLARFQRFGLNFPIVWLFSPVASSFFVSSVSVFVCCCPISVGELSNLISLVYLRQGESDIFPEGKLCLIHNVIISNYPCYTPRSPIIGQVS